MPRAARPPTSADAGKDREQERADSGRAPSVTKVSGPSAPSCLTATEGQHPHQGSDSGRQRGRRNRAIQRKFRSHDSTEASARTEIGFGLKHAGQRRQMGGCYATTKAAPRADRGDACGGGRQQQIDLDWRSAMGTQLHPALLGALAGRRPGDGRRNRRCGVS